jgi:hypothetical protein
VALFGQPDGNALVGSHVGGHRVLDGFLDGTRGFFRAVTRPRVLFGSRIVEIEPVGDVARDGFVAVEQGESLEPVKLVVCTCDGRLR